LLEFYKNNQDIYYQDIEYWNKRFLDIEKFYQIDTTCGWRLRVIRATRGEYEEFYIYPSYVGIKNIDNYSSNLYRPDVSNCIVDAYTFYTENKNSNYSADFYDVDDAFSISMNLYNIPNDYYIFEFYGTSKYLPYNTFKHDYIGTGGYVEDFYSRVFVEQSKSTHYHLVRNNKAIYKDIIWILSCGFILISLLFIILYYYKNKKINKKNEILNETLHSQLKRKCHPSNFMIPYDKNRIEKASKIYEGVTHTFYNETDKLKKLRREAINDLGINFVSIEYFEFLESKCNPNQFLKPFNSEKFNLSNQLYDKLQKNKNYIEVLEEIESEINLYLN